MNTGVLVGLAGATGGVAGGMAGYKATRPVSEWANRLRAADIDHLESGQPLPVMAEPKTIHRQRHNRFLIYLLSVLGAGAAVAVILGVVTALIVHGVSGTTDMMPGERVLAFLGTGAVGAFIGFIIGAVFGGVLGAILDVREIRARLQNERGRLIRDVWERREQLRSDLAEGRLTPQATINRLRSEMGA